LLEGDIKEMMYSSVLIKKTDMTLVLLNNNKSLKLLFRTYDISL